MRLTDLQFDAWLEHAFGREVRPQASPWFFDDDADWRDPEPATALAHLARLFENPEPALRWFSDGQVAQGLTYLLSTSASGDKGWFRAASVPVARRLRCVQTIGLFFAELFAPRRAPRLSHLGEAAAGTLHAAALGTMADILALSSVACQESALHGLGHWQRRHPEQVTPIVDAFLARDAALDPHLVGYARSARCGCVH